MSDEKNPIPGTPLEWPFDLYEDYEGGLHIIDATTRIVLDDTYAYDNSKEVRVERMMVLVRALNRQLGPVVVTGREPPSTCQRQDQDGRACVLPAAHPGPHNSPIGMFTDDDAKREEPASPLVRLAFIVEALTLARWRETRGSRALEAGDLYAEAHQIAKAFRK